MGWESYTLSDDYLSISFEGMKEVKNKIISSIDAKKTQRENISRAIESLQVPDSVLRGYGNDLIPIKNSISKDIDELVRMSTHIDYVMRRFEEVDNEYAARFKSANYGIQEKLGLHSASAIFGACTAGLTSLVSQVTKPSRGRNNESLKKAMQQALSSLNNKNAGKPLLFTGKSKLVAQSKKMYDFTGQKNLAQRTSSTIKTTSKVKKVTLYYIITGAKTEVDADDTVTINNLLNNGYSYNCPEGTGKTVVPASDVSYTTFDISKAPLGVQKQLKRLFAQLKEIQEKHGLYTMGIKLQDEDEAIEDTLLLIEGQIQFASSDLGKVVGRIQSAGAGTIQFVGGVTETMTGAAIFTGTSWTGVGIPVGIAGGNMAIDGASNATGGASKVYNAVFGNNEGDTLNFMKVAYKKISPEYGESIYNLTQLGIGFYCVGKGLTELPSSSAKVYARPKNITRAQSEGLSYSTDILDVNNQMVVTTRTQSGMILERTIIDKSKLKSGALFIGVDAKNTKDAKDALH